MTHLQAARKATTLATAIAHLHAQLIDLRHDAPATANSEQELALGALMMAADALVSAEQAAKRAAGYFGDGRTEQQIAEQHAEQLRAKQAREDALRGYGCTL